MTKDERLQNKKPNLLFNKEKRQQVQADIKDKPAYLNQRNIISHFFFGPYALLPVISALVWFGGLWALLGLWVSQGKPRYRGDEASVVFVSDGESNQNCPQSHRLIIMTHRHPIFPSLSRRGQPRPLHLYNRHHRRLLHPLPLGRTLVEAHGPIT
jgi:hypothetical protein